MRLVTQAPLRGDAQPVLAPIIEGYVTVNGLVLQLIGVDPFAIAELQGGRAGLPAEGAALDPGELRSWFLGRGAVVMAADTARQLGLRAGGSLTVDVGGVRHPGHLMHLLRTDRPGDATLMLTDIAQAQEWLQHDAAV